MLTCVWDFDVEKTKDGYKVIKLKKESKSIYIGSKYNMQNEIDKFLDKLKEKVKNADKSVFVIYGFGNGEHIKALRSEFKKNKIIVFEPNINLLNFASNLEYVRNDENIKIICCEQSRFIDEFCFGISESNINMIELDCFSNYSVIYKEEYKEFLKAFEFLIKNLISNKFTALLYSKLHFDSLLHNLRYVFDGTPIYEYKNMYKNKPAIIVSAGPSLDKNIKELINADGKMLILSSTRTLNGIMDLGIQPNLLVALDPRDNTFNIMKKSVDIYNGPLLFYEGTNKLVVSNHNGDKIFYTKSKFINNIMENRMPEIVDDGTVAIIMMDFAILSGCNPIIFIGQDLAYTGNNEHAMIAENKIDKGKNKLLKEDIYVDGINNEKIKTSIILNGFRLNIEKLIEDNPEIDFINATEGGARIKGTKEMTLKEVIKHYNNVKLDPIKKINCNIDIKKNTLEQLKIAKTISKEIINLCNSCLTNLEQLKEAHEDKNNEKVSNILGVLQKSDEYIEKNYEKIELIESLLIPVSFNILEKNNNIDDAEYKSEIEMIYYQSYQLYSGFIDTLNYALKPICELIAELSRQK
ncbi:MULTISPECIES: 6-hydroxymethylpterin diphosphokinase MptE-like protein [unclassified Clostridium]|uniref:motility associated factor glycosyltransferase family protein n=1 Tax=unclassified Clostridium TaxID=2614128 RepID=UPI0002974753|nr:MULTISPECIES: 6-hydroxymethylpterin diphosphokinase MptE-like protein [unclassified Clostridium]EKQ51133.1 MAG: hypothetical protein A370_05160 [Clostridium sp. Maddingley MBC34-26]